MSAQAASRPRAEPGTLIRFAYNLLLLLGCALPLSGAAMLGVMWMQDSVASARDGMLALAVIYTLSVIPVGVCGAMFLAVAASVAPAHPEWRRGIALALAAACVGGLLCFADPLTRDTMPGWMVLAAGLCGWAWAIHLEGHPRPTQTEWIVAAAPGLLLSIVAALYAYSVIQ